MTPQSAVVTLQHIITRHQSEPDVVFTAASAIAEVATDAANAGIIVDPLLGADDYDPSPAVVAEPAQQDTQTGLITSDPQSALPPDPDGMNGERAAWAEAAIAEFRGQTGTDSEDALSDLLGDLMHWCDRKGFDFHHEIERARNHYLAEIDPNG